MSYLKVGIDGQRLDFGSSNQLVTSVVAKLEVLYLAALWTLGLILSIAIEEAEIIVVGGDRTEHVVPDDLHADVVVVGVDQGERLTGDIAEQAPMVLGEPDLRRILFGRILVRRRPVDALSRDDMHLHPALDLVVNPRRHQVLHLAGVVRCDQIAWLDLRVAWCRAAN